MSADLVLFPGVITHFVWVLLAFMALVVACGALWIVGASSPRWSRKHV